MQFLTSLFGGTENTLMTTVLSLGIVLVLIVFSVWVLKFFFRASTNLGRGTNRRLAIVDSVSIDPKRQLIIVRRDNVEHLILTGGPQDLVVESNIAVEKPDSVARRARVTPTAVAALADPGPAPSRSVTEALEAAQSIAPAPAPAANRPMERLRELARPSSPRKPGSLRHTGLLRPINQGEPAAIIPINADNSEHRRIDSAKAAPANDTDGQAKLGGGTYIGNGVKAEGN